MAIPSRASSVITAVSRVQQNLSSPVFVMGGRNASTYKLFKKSTTYAFNMWRSPVYRIGSKFDVMKIKFAVTPAMTTNMSIIPVLYFDNEASNSIGATINSTNYTNSERYIVLTAKNFSNATRGQDNFFLELQFTGSALAVVKLPITIEIETIET